MDSPYCVVYLVTHPIQYQAPLMRYIVANSDIDLTVLFLSDFSLQSYKDPGFGAAVQWDVPLLQGYKHQFLPRIGADLPISATRPLAYGIGSRLRALRPDALWVHGYAHLANLRAMAYAKMMGVKVFVRAESQQGSQSGSARTRRIKEPLLRKLFARVDAFLAIGSLNADYYRHYGVPDCKIHSMPYAVDNAFFQAQAGQARPQREELRAALGLAPGRPIILFASKFIARKRAGDLLEAYIGLSTDGKKEPDPYLIFIGDGEQRGELEARAKATGWNSILFPGFKNQTELPAYFDLCDLFVLPSETEPWGLIVNEVMNCGRALLVTSDVGAAPDLVCDGENGFVVPPRDVALLRSRLQTMTANPDLMRRMGKRSLERIDRWGFREDLQGLQSALEATVARNLLRQSAAHEKHT